MVEKKNLLDKIDLRYTAEEMGNQFIEEAAVTTRNICVSEGTQFWSGI